MTITIRDADQWRRVCLKAFENLPQDTRVQMADVDRVLTIGAQRAESLDTSTQEGVKAYGAVCREIASATGLDDGDVDAILTWAGGDAAALLVPTHE